MIILKILQEFLLPSVFLPALTLVGLILVFRKRRQKTGKILIISAIILYYLFSITPVADFILHPLENQYQPIQKEQLKKADIAVLLLGGKESDVLRASEVLRIFNFNLQIVISGTNPLNPKINPGKKVEVFLTERGIPPENIILENRSKTTAESAKNLKKVLGEKPFFLITSAYHMPRAIEILRKFGMNPIAAPTDFKIEKRYDVSDFLPHAKNLRNCNLAFHEYFGILFYRLEYGYLNPASAKPAGGARRQGARCIHIPQVLANEADSAKWALAEGKLLSKSP